MKSTISVIVMVLCFCFSATAALIERDYGVVYDTDINLTWLKDAGASNHMTWYQATDWIKEMHHLNFTDWRLPTMQEMEHLFFDELSGAAGVPICFENNDPDLQLFTHISPLTSGTIDAYWSSQINPNDSGYVSVFGFNNGPYSGYWRYDAKDWMYNFAWAVHDGDIGAVPIPGAVWLLGSGLIGFIGIRKKLRK